MIANKHITQLMLDIQNLQKYLTQRFQLLQQQTEQKSSHQLKTNNLEVLSPSSTSKLKVLSCCCRWQIPSTKLEQAKEHLFIIAAQSGGFYLSCVETEGWWLNINNNWVLDQMSIAVCFMSLIDLISNLPMLLSLSRTLCREIGEDCICMEISLPLGRFMLLISP